MSPREVVMAVLGRVIYAALGAALMFTWMVKFGG